LSWYGHAPFVLYEDPYATWKETAARKTNDDLVQENQKKMDLIAQNLRSGAVEGGAGYGLGGGAGDGLAGGPEGYGLGEAPGGDKIQTWLQKQGGGGARTQERAFFFWNGRKKAMAKLDVYAKLNFKVLYQ
jgi:hypothetical protein